MKRGDVVGGRFEVEELAGAGAMGVVYRARDRGSGETVALKVLRPGAEMHRFTRETRLLAELSHPGIVRYVAHGTSDDGPYLAMEWLEGISLSDRLRRAELPLSDAIGLVARAAAAIGAAHRRWIVHRDLKPSNLFLVDGGLDAVKVLDFGVARHGALSSELTRTGMMIGSPRYMAPEQVTAGKNVDARADVWALGVVLFRCATGALPYGDAPTELLLAEVLTSVAPRARSVRPDIPEELDALIASMLSREPNDRPPDGEAVARALGELTAAEGAAPESRAPERQVLTLAEQRFACTLLVTGAAHQAVSDLVKPHGGSAFALEGGHSAVTFTARGTATDLLQQSARAALAARKRFSGCRIALVTGIAEGTASSRPEPDLLSRAHALLRREDLSGDVLVDATSAALLDASFDLDKAADGSAVLTGERRQLTSLRRLLGRATPCVGRERELSTLQALYEECVDEPVARVVLVTGGAGVGKSRLRYELLRRIAELPGSVAPAIWIGRGDPTRAGAPFGLLASALTDGLEVQATTSQRAQLQQVARRVAELVPEADAARIAFNVAQTLGFRSEDVDTLPGQDDPMLLGDEMRAAFEDLVTSVCSARPLILVLEDLHWGDWATIRFVDAALRQLRDAPLFVVALARPEVLDLFPGLWSERGLHQLPLGELGRRASEQLVRALLGDRLEHGAVKALVERSMGNAFFLEELIRAVAESPDQSALPPTVLAMAQARVDALAPEARHMLRAASVFGQVFWLGAVAALVGGANDDREVRQWLELLSEHELVSHRRESRFAGEVEYVFRHALIRDAAYAMLTDADRLLGHRLAASWLQDAGERDAFVLAEHLMLGGEADRAAPLYLRAAAQALEGNDFAAALAHVGRAEASGLQGAELGEARLLAAAAHHWRGELTEQEQAASEAMGLFTALSPRWYAAAGEAARVASRLGRHERVAEVVDSLRGDRRPETAAARAELLARLGVPAIRAGLAELHQRIQTELGAAEPLLGDEPTARAWLMRLRGYEALVAGDTSTYLQLSEAAAAELEGVRDQRTALTLKTSVGFANIALGRYAEAERVLRLALGGAERLGLATVELVAKHNLGYAVALLGRLDEGILLETECVAGAIAHKDRWIECVSETYLADLLLRAGRLADAERAAHRAHELSDRPNRVLALALLSRVELALGKKDDARATVEQSHALLEELGSVEDGEAMARLAFVEVHEAVGNADTARRELAKARDRLVARAKKIADPELRESFLTQVPENASTLELARARGV